MALLRLFIVLALLFPGPGAVGAEAPTPIAIGFYMPVFRDTPRRDVEVSLHFWIEELATAAGVTYAPLKFFDSMAQLKRNMNAGMINVVVAPPMGIAQHFSEDELADGFTARKPGPYDLLLAVRRAAGIHSPADLAGKRAVIVEQDELSQIYLETLMMQAFGKTGTDRLGEIRRVLHSNELALNLFFDKSDAALIPRSLYDTAVALNPQVAQRLQVLEEHSFKGGSPSIGLISTRVPPERRESFVRSVLKLNDHPRGRQVLQIYKADSMVATPSRDLEPYRQLLAKYHALKAAPARRAAR